MFLELQPLQTAQPHNHPRLQGGNQAAAAVKPKVTQHNGHPRTLTPASGLGQGTKPPR